MSTPTIRGALERLVELDNSSPMQDGQWAIKHENAIADALEALAAEPVGEGPSESEIDAFIHQWWELYGKGYLPNSSDKALVAAALARWARPAAPAAPEPGRRGGVGGQAGLDRRSARRHRPERRFCLCSPRRRPAPAAPRACPGGGAGGL